MRVTRRTFVHQSGVLLGGTVLTSLGACSRSISPEASPEDTWRAAVDALDRRIPVLMSELHVPGVSVALIRDARIAWQKAFGVRDAGSKAAVDDGTVWEAQSMSKPVFAYRVMKLAEAGVIDLDAPLVRYTSDILVSGDPRMDQVTARHVLAHTTGWPNWRSKDDPMRFDFTPGERWSYSGEGFSYLQSVVSRLTGRIDERDCGGFELDYRVCATDFGAAMTDHLLAPFGMTSSGYLVTGAIGPRLARRHDGKGQPMTLINPTARDVARYGAAGALLSTAADYARFIIEVMDPKPADAYRLNQASRAEMLRPQVKVPDSPIPASWALGWQVWHLPNGDVHAHGGDVEGTHSQSGFSLARKSGFVIMTNGEGGLELIAKRLLKDLVDGFC